MFLKIIFKLKKYKRICGSKHQKKLKRWTTRPQLKIPSIHRPKHRPLLLEPSFFHKKSVISFRRRFQRPSDSQWSDMLCSASSFLPSKAAHLELIAIKQLRPNFLLYLASSEFQGTKKRKNKKKQS